MSPEQKTFHCPEWPACGCPDGAVRHDCPGLGKKPARVMDVAGLAPRRVQAVMSWDEFYSVDRPHLPRPSAAINPLAPAPAGNFYGEAARSTTRCAHNGDDYPPDEGAPNDWGAPYMGEPDGFTPREVTVLVAITLAAGILLGGSTAVMSCIGGWL